MKKKMKHKIRRVRKLKKMVDEAHGLAETRMNIQEMLGTNPGAYDADEGPVAADWLNLDERDRMILVERYHSENGLLIDGPDADKRNKAHAVGHVVVENQVALGLETTVGQTLYRLERSLGRHGAIHGIGMVFMEYLWKAAHGRKKLQPEEYEKAVADLTVEKVHQMQDAASGAEPRG